MDARSNVDAGQAITLAVDMNKAHFFDADSEERIDYQRQEQEETQEA